LQQSVSWFMNQNRNVLSAVLNVSAVWGGYIASSAVHFWHLEPWWRRGVVQITQSSIAWYLATTELVLNSDDIHRLVGIVVFSFLHSRLRTCTLRSDHEGQSTLMNLLLRNYLTYNLYDQADKLVSKATFPESASNNEWARYLFYLGILFNVYCWTVIWCEFILMCSYHSLAASCLDADVEARIQIGGNKLRQLVPLLTNRDMSLIMRGRLYSSHVQSSMLHGSETWPVRRE